MKKIILICGARPNFMKIAPLKKAIELYNVKFERKQIKSIIVHTGQHYDYEMSRVFFKDLKLTRPDIHLNVGSGCHGEQTARIMMRLEKVLLREKPDLVIVVGDVNSTLAAALVSVKMYIPVAHVEAGLRSFDRSMPEEINRVITDSISDFLFTPCQDANTNLNREGVAKNRVFFVGDIMIDTLLANRKKIDRIKKHQDLDLGKGQYAVLTLHRPGNVDAKSNFRNILSALNKIVKEIPIIFPIHPRTLKQVRKFGLEKYFSFNKKDIAKKIKLIKPLGYLEFQSLLKDSKFIMTDSGGIQEEATVLNIPCLTLRDTTERPVTIKQGTNILVGNDTRRILKEALKIIKGKCKVSKIPPKWDGRTAERVLSVLIKKLFNAEKRKF